MANKPAKASQWELEGSFDRITSIEELVNAPPFREASDDRGQSVTQAARIPTWLHRRIVMLRETKRSPYMLNSDVVRDAIFAGLRIINMRYQSTPDWSVEQKMSEVVDTAAWAKRIKEQFTQLEVSLGDLFTEGDEEKAAEKLTEYILYAAELTNEWHKSRVFRLLARSTVVRDLFDYCDKAARLLLTESKEDVGYLDKKGKKNKGGKK